MFKKYDAFIARNDPVVFISNQPCQSRYEHSRTVRAVLSNCVSRAVKVSLALPEIGSLDILNQSATEQP